MTKTPSPEVLAQVKAALEFYAKEQNYEAGVDLPAPVRVDQGSLARNALAMLSVKSQDLCETTLTESFYNPKCACKTYPENLGPCKTFERGAGTQCVYCDHEKICHEKINGCLQGDFIIEILQNARSLIAQNSGMIGYCLNFNSKEIHDGQKRSIDAIGLIESVETILTASPIPEAINDRTLPELPKGLALHSLQQEWSSRKQKFIWRTILHDPFGDPIGSSPRGEGPTPRAAVLVALSKIESGK